MSDKSKSVAKTRITIRLDNDVLESFRNEAELSDGGNYQTLINRALREYLLAREGLTEELLRRVIREELASLRGGPVSFKTNTSLFR